MAAITLVALFTLPVFAQEAEVVTDSEVTESTTTFTLSDGQVQDTIQPYIDKLDAWRLKQLAKLEVKQNTSPDGGAFANQLRDILIGVGIFILSKQILSLVVAGLLVFAIIFWLYNAFT